MTLQEWMAHTDQFTARGADGHNRVFRLLAGETNSQFEYSVYSDPPPEDGEFFELTLTQVNGLGLQIAFIGHPHRHPNYRGMGIPNPLLPLVARRVNQRIWSSRKGVPRPAEFQTHLAIRMWDRLVEDKLACYDSVRGRYCVDP